MSNVYRGPSIDASYQVSVHLAVGFQRIRLKCEKLTDDKWWQKLTLPLARWANKNSTLPFCNVTVLLDKLHSFQIRSWFAIQICICFMTVIIFCVFIHHKTVILYNLSIQMLNHVHVSLIGWKKDR
jgi:hypothetical protein